MPSIASPGLGSGLDINQIVSSLMALESRPLVLLDQKEGGFQAKLSAYGSLKGAMAAFQTSMQGLSGVASFQSLTATSADPTIFNATADSSAIAGSYAIEVKQLAQAHKLASAAFTSTTEEVGTGTLTIQYGTFSGVFTANADKPSQTVTIDSAHSSLAGVRDAINEAKVGVTATILNDGSGYKLVIASKEGGAANSLKITVADTSDASDTDNAGLSRLAYDPEGSAGNGKNLTETVTAQNALLKIDGLDNINSATNTVTDVIAGVTLNLAKVSALNTPTTLTVAEDTAAVKTAVKDFVDAYNGLNTTVSSLTAYDATTQRGSILLGDSTAVSILTQVRRTLTSTITGLGGPLTLLSQVGVEFQTDGTLKLDTAKLDAALGANFKDIAGLFAAVGKPSDSLVRYASATDKTQAGSYAVNVTQLATQGFRNGSGTAALADTGGTFDTPFVIDANNDSVSLKVDGIQSGSITLALGSYTTAAALTAEIQSKINGDSALKDAGVSVQVSFDSSNDRLVVTSARYGSASTVELTAVDTNTASTLGLSVGSGTTGVDVAGSINGVAASGSGRFLTGGSGDNSEGLKLEIVGGATGNRGTVGYSQGYAVQLEKLATQMLADTGSIASRTDGLNDSVADINDQRVALNQRLEAIEKRYRAQFTALDQLISQLRSTSDFLTQQLNNLPGARAPSAR